MRFREHLRYHTIEMWETLLRARFCMLAEALIRHAIVKSSTHRGCIPQRVLFDDMHFDTRVVPMFGAYCRMQDERIMPVVSADDAKAPQASLRKALGTVDITIYSLFDGFSLHAYEVLSKPTDHGRSGLHGVRPIRISEISKRVFPRSECSPVPSIYLNKSYIGSSMIWGCHTCVSRWLWDPKPLLLRR